MNEMILSETFKRTGTSFSELKDLLLLISQHTQIQTVTLSSLSVLYYLKDYVSKIKRDGLYFSIYLDGEEKRIFLDQKRVSSYLMQALQESKTLIKQKDSSGYFLISKAAIADLFKLMQITVNEDALQTPSKYRNLWMSELMEEKQEPVTLITREQNGLQKIFAVQSAQYKYIDQMLLIYLMQIFMAQGYEVKNWEVTNTITTINMENKEHMGFHILTSDTGDFSFAVYPVFFTEHSFVIINDTDNVKFLHRQSVSNESCEKKDKRKIENIAQYALEAFDDFIDKRRDAENRTVTIHEHDDLQKELLKLCKATDFAKIAGKKNIVKHAQSANLSDIRKMKTEDDLWQYLWDLDYPNKEDIHSYLRFQKKKKCD